MDNDSRLQGILNNDLDVIQRVLPELSLGDLHRLEQLEARCDNRIEVMNAIDQTFVAIAEVDEG